MIFIDSNILIDVILPDGSWRPWSLDRLADADHPLTINHVVVAEIARHFSSSDEIGAYLTDMGVAVSSMTSAAAFRAGRAYNAYRKAGGERSGMLADFLIGGHAVDLGATLLTRDRQRFASYFPDLTLITPETDHG